MIFFEKIGTQRIWLAQSPKTEYVSLEHWHQKNVWACFFFLPCNIVVGDYATTGRNSVPQIQLLYPDSLGMSNKRSRQSPLTFLWLQEWVLKYRKTSCTCYWAELLMAALKMSGQRQWLDIPQVLEWRCQQQGPALIERSTKNEAHLDH